MSLIIPSTTSQNIELLGNFDEESLTALRKNPDVEYIEEDGIMHIFQESG